MSTEVLWSLVFGAIIVETVVNIIENIKADERCWKYWVALGGGVVIALIVSINYDIDVFKLVGLEGKVPIIGAILTGLIISRGSNIVSDTVGVLNSWKAK